MIQISRPNGKVIRVIPDDEFFNHISGEELLEEHPEFEGTTTHWSFVIFPPERVHDLYFKLKPESVTPTLRQAYGQQFGLIEICQGDYNNPTWVPMTRNLDRGMLKKEWYFAYCRAHGYVVNKIRAENDEVSFVASKGKRENAL